MKLYLAGPMRGIPDFNFPAFLEAAVRLRAAGYEVFSPAEKDLDRVGDIFTGTKGDQTELDAQGFNLGEALLIDLTYIALKADAVALLPGWETSKGVAAERALAEAMGKPVASVATFLGE